MPDHQIAVVVSEEVISEPAPLELLKKLGIVRLQDAVLDIVAAGSAHGEDSFSAHVKHLPALQQEHRGPNAADLPAVPVLQWVCPQGVIVFVVPRDEEGGKGPALQEVQPLIIPMISVPYAAQVSASTTVICSTVMRTCSSWYSVLTSR